VVVQVHPYHLAWEVFCRNNGVLHTEYIDICLRTCFLRTANCWIVDSSGSRLQLFHYPTAHSMSFGRTLSLILHCWYQTWFCSWFVGF